MKLVLRTGRTDDAEAGGAKAGGAEAGGAICYEAFKTIAEQRRKLWRRCAD